MVRYLNTKINGTTETVDSLNSNDFKTLREFFQEKRRLIFEYNLAGGHGNLYWSQRSVKGY